MPLEAENNLVEHNAAVEKMEEIVNGRAALLKLSDATQVMELIEEDGGKQGVTEITNFWNLLKEVDHLPQYLAVLEEYGAWKKDNRTVQQVRLWTQKKIADGTLDQAWI